MAISIATGLQRLDSISSLNRTIIDKDWIKAEAAATVSTTTRANSALTQELFIADTPERTQQIRAEMEVNRNTTSTALETLDKLLAYGQRDAALAQLCSDMLPKLSRLQDSVRELNEMQKATVTQNGELVKHDISMSRQMMAWLGVVALASSGFRPEEAYRARRMPVNCQRAPAGKKLR